MNASAKGLLSSSLHSQRPPDGMEWNGMEWLKRQQPNDTEEDRGGFKGVIGSLA